MKRRASDSDLGKALVRRARSSADARSMCIPTWKPLSPTSTSSKQDLRSVEQHSLEHTSHHTWTHIPEQQLAFIRSWLNDVRPEYGLSTMVITPRGTHTSRGRSSGRHRRTPNPQSSMTTGTRASRTTDSKATKTVTPQTYRVENLRYNRIHVDAKVELPPEIDAYVRHILGISSWEDRVPAPTKPASQQTFVELADTYQTKSRSLARCYKLESDWQQTLYQVVSTIVDLFGGVLESTASEKLWNPQLTPGSQNKAHELVETNSPNTDASAVMVTDPDYSDSMSLLYDSKAIPSTVPGSTKLAGLPRPTTPKPDVTVGLADIALTMDHQLLLAEYQQHELILSEPHAARMGLRFPFIIMELKATALLVEAQNQAAVGGACMLKILKDLTNQAARSANLHLEQASLLKTPAELSPVLAFCFSIVTEGPVHELWVHFEHEDGFHMFNVKIWRTTMRGHAEELVNCLGRIAAWGNGDFKDRIVKMLDQLPHV